MKQNRRKKLICYLLVAAMTVGICCYAVSDGVVATLNEDEAVKFSVYSRSNNIEESTLFIGTYLINMSALTDDLYESTEFRQ